MRLWATVLTMGLWLTAATAGAAPVRAVHLQAELAPQTQAAPGATVYVALHQIIDSGWHTYWRNPGDSGQATTITWTVPKGWTVGDMVWPLPRKLPTGPLMDYGYTGEVYLPVPIQVPRSAKPGSTAHIQASAHFLVCQDVCIPADAALTLDLPVVAGAPAPDPVFAGPVGQALAAAPREAGLTAVFAAAPDALKLAVTGPAVKGKPVADAYFFPYDGSVIDHAKHQTADRGPDGLTLVLAPGLAFQPGGQPLTKFSGVVALGGQGYVVNAAPGPLPAGAAGLGGGSATSAMASNAPAPRDMGLITAVAFAFLGGLVLNLMPCVFPVLSIKAAALAAHRDDAAKARLQGLAFLGGVVASFLLLAGALIAAKAAGQSVGWGFQLQSPGVVGGLCLILLLAGLNLSGVFELGTSAQGLGAGLAARQDLIGAVFTGVLAVVVAAPCTAPFMAGAIGWAFTQPAPYALLVFLGLGLGLALPFTLVAMIPALTRLIPRPGRWMVVLRSVLAFPMYGSAAWLAWVFALQAGIDAEAFLLAAAVAAAFAAWAWGFSQASTKPLTARLWATAGMIGAAVLVAAGAGAAEAPGQTTQTAKRSALPTEPWSPARVDELRAQGKPVFVDFTAAWCITCQVNERTALATHGVADAFRRTGAIYLKADWTNPDPAIARALADQGRSGVPLYLVYGPSGPPAVLPQILTEGVVVDALTKAKGGA
ncbi:MAG TPA: thioredoxin family protein [Caulobacteraceae bacterium]|nr:thioredoxin family protein [Caulobacteraceae bacterium]